jgi:Transglycosylase SLT domain
MRAGFMLLSVAVLIAATPTCADAMGQKVGETVEEVSCRIVEQAASTNQLSIATLTRLLWNEGRFQVGAVSRAGAQGVAQFMPATSDEQGLSAPFVSVGRANENCGSEQAERRGLFARLTRRERAQCFVSPAPRR